MATIEIKHCWTGAVLHTGEYGTLREAVLDAVEGGVNLNGACLIRLDLSGADLREADLSGAALSGANLGGADLRGADVRGGELSGANGGGAGVRWAEVGGEDFVAADGGAVDD